MRTFITCVIIANCTAAAAQSPYRPFPGTGAGWNLWSNGLYFYCNPVESYTSTVTWTVGDTATINGHLCHSLWRSEFGSWQAEGMPAGGPCPPSGTIAIPNTQHDYFWQDTVARKIYYGTDESQLAYDLTIGLGTYPETVFNMNYPFTQVVALDSMELNDGWHRTWVLGMDQGGSITDSAFCTVIEGVGTTYGPFAYLVPPFEFLDTLTCFSAGPTIYPQGAVACDLSMRVEPRVKTPVAITLAPDPVVDHAQVLREGPAVEALIVDVAGRAIRAIRLAAGPSTLDMSGLRCGTYALRLASGEVLRFVKQ